MRCKKQRTVLLRNLMMPRRLCWKPGDWVLKPSKLSTRPAQDLSQPHQLIECSRQVSFRAEASAAIPCHTVLQSAQPISAKKNIPTQILFVQFLVQFNNTLAEQQEPKKKLNPQAKQPTMDTERLADWTAEWSHRAPQWGWKKGTECAKLRAWHSLKQTTDAETEERQMGSRRQGELDQTSKRENQRIRTWR